MSELARMSGDSSEQMSYLNEQLREKDREIEELHSTVATLSEEASRSKDKLERSQDSTSQELSRLREGQDRERREYFTQVEVLVRQGGLLSSETVGQEVCSIPPCVHCLQTSELEEQKSLLQSERKRLEEEKAVRKLVDDDCWCHFHLGLLSVAPLSFHRLQRQLAGPRFVS